MRAAATAALCGIPAAVSPPTSPTSMTPAPPGTGTAPPIIEARVSTTMSVAKLACCPTACSDAPRHSAMNSWLAVDPASTYTILRGWAAIAFASVQAETDRIGCLAAVAASAGLEHEGTKPLGPPVRAARGRPGQLFRRRDRRLRRQGRPAIQRLTRGTGR